MSPNRLIAVFRALEIGDPVGFAEQSDEAIAAIMRAIADQAKEAVKLRAEIVDRDLEIAELKKRIAEPEQDASRLDAIERGRWEIAADENGLGFAVMQPRRYGDDRQLSDYLPLRSAIDQAIATALGLHREKLRARLVDRRGGALVSPAEPNSGNQSP